MHNEIEASSGNVFADLGLPDADALKRKSGLIVAMSEAIDRRGLGEEEAAQLAGLTTGELVRLLLGDFSRTEPELERLLGVLNGKGVKGTVE
jgi:predicted XRE-type DNA-binding protein